MKGSLNFLCARKAHCTHHAAASKKQANVASDICPFGSSAIPLTFHVTIKAFCFPFCSRRDISSNFSWGSKYQFPEHNSGLSLLILPDGEPTSPLLIHNSETETGALQDRPDDTLNSIYVATIVS